MHPPCESTHEWVTPNVAKTLYRRVGCAHQTSLIPSVKGGRSPPYINKGTKTQSETFGYIHLRAFVS